VDTQQIDNSDKLVAQLLQSTIEQLRKTKLKCVLISRPTRWEPIRPLLVKLAEMVSNSSRQLMRLTGSFETCLALFRNCAGHNKRNKTEQLALLSKNIGFSE